MNAQAPGASVSARTQRIEALLVPVVQQAGMTLEAVTVTPAGKRRLVRILVDRAVHVDDEDRASSIPPLSLDEVGDVTRLVSEALDEADAMGEAPYVLEVGSPGTDRPLVTAQHFRRNVGRLINLTVVGEEKPTLGRITGAGATTFDVAVTTGKSHGPQESTSRSVGYDDVERARIELEFNRPSESMNSTDSQEQN